MLASLHPGVTLEEVQEQISWELKLADKIQTTPPPTEEEITVIRQLDANNIFIGNGLKNISFDSYIRLLENSLETL